MPIQPHFPLFVLDDAHAFRSRFLDSLQLGLVQGPLPQEHSPGLVGFIDLLLLDIVDPFHEVMELIRLVHQPLDLLGDALLEELQVAIFLVAIDRDSEGIVVDLL